MKLNKFRVRKFRSIQDSGWIDLDLVTALLGENESGKTNLLLPLWKLCPASGGKIDLLADAPRGEYSEIRALPDTEKPIFISAVFECDNMEKESISKIANCDSDWIKTIKFQRRYDGQYIVSFPDANPTDYCESSMAREILENQIKSVRSTESNKTDIKLKDVFLKKISDAIDRVKQIGDTISNTQLELVIEIIEQIDITKASKTGGFIESRRNCLEKLSKIKEDISRETPDRITDAREEALRLIPAFVYYANYGNLDSEIYLPHVIQNLHRQDLGEKEAAKARTLKVLFEFVNLKPQEIQALGMDLSPYQNPTPEQFQAKSEEKKERSVLLESASAGLTKAFGSWWKQGNYDFRFAADGDHFRIWVSDTIRPEKIELENRSTGLQWFFSFFLVFLNERNDAHFGSILLLDEPGITLHPMAQKDLSAFFEGLSIDNQLIYTTHSPFLLGSDKLDQVRAVDIGEDGCCVARLET